MVSIDAATCIGSFWHVGEADYRGPRSREYSGRVGASCTRSIQWVVAYGLAHRSLDGIRAIGVDEIAVWAGHKYLTVVYQIDQGARRLLWIGRERTEATFRKFFDEFGETRAKALQFIASDMWQ